jgi:hypothetical protein
MQYARQKAIKELLTNKWEINPLISMNEPAAIKIEDDYALYQSWYIRDSNNRHITSHTWYSNTGNRQETEATVNVIVNAPRMLQLLVKSVGYLIDANETLEEHIGDDMLPGSAALTDEIATLLSNVLHCSWQEICTINKELLEEKLASSITEL